MEPTKKKATTRPRRERAGSVSRYVGVSSTAAAAASAQRAALR